MQIKRYYLYNFLVSAADIGTGHLTMVYFYFHGFSIVAILGAILTYGITCLLILKPVGILIEKIGPQATFRLHAIAEILKYLALLCIFIFPEYQLAFFLLLQFFNGFNVMLGRIPLTAYFSVYGSNDIRGAQIGLTNNIQVITGVLVPIVAGALIQETGIILVTTITMLINVVSTFVLKFDNKVRMQNPIQLRRLMSSVPSVFTKAFFFGKLPYPFAADLLSIYIAISLQSFVVLGILIGLRTAATIVLNYIAGRLTDSRSIRRIFFWCVLVGSTFWLILPFVHSAQVIFALQFTLGLIGLITTIPFESAYHNAAKQSEQSLEFALWREIVIQIGLVIGTGLAILVLQSGLVSDWTKLLPFGALSLLALLFALPFIGSRQSVAR